MLVERARRALDAGIPRASVVLDAGLDLGKTAAQSLTLLRASRELVDTGYPVLLSASNKTFLGDVLGLELNDAATHRSPRPPSGSSSDAASCRVHDVEGTRQVRDTLAAVMRGGRRPSDRPGHRRLVSGRAARGPPDGRRRRRPSIWCGETMPRCSWARPCTACSDGSSAIGIRRSSWRSMVDLRADDLDVGAVIDAWSTPPFLVDRRVVVVRDAGRLTAADAGRVGGGPEDPPPMSVLLLVGGEGPCPRAWSRRREPSARSSTRQWGPGGAGSSWIEDQVGTKLGAALTPASPPDAQRSIWVSDLEPAGRAPRHARPRPTGRGRGSDVDELDPFLGEAGFGATLGPDRRHRRRRTEDALAALHRQLAAGGRSAPEILGACCTDTSRPCSALDGSGVSTAEEAAALLGTRSTFVAKKALQRSSQLGFDRIGQADLAPGPTPISTSRVRRVSRPSWCSRCWWRGSAA